MLQALRRSTGEIAAVQRAWRDFRIAASSCERDDAALPKIWTLTMVALAI
jgi:hypothetical protein